MQPFEYRSVRQRSKEINGTLTGGREEFFLIRGSSAAKAMAAAPVESSQSLPKRCPWGRLGSVLYTCARLRRIRRRFNHFWSISLSRPQRNSNFYAFVASRALREHLAAASTAYAAQALTHYQTYPVRPPGAALPPQKVCNLGPMAPRPRQKRQLPEGPQ